MFYKVESQVFFTNALWETSGVTLFLYLGPMLRSVTLLKKAIFEFLSFLCWSSLLNHHLTHPIIFWNIFWKWISLVKFYRLLKFQVTHQYGDLNYLLSWEPQKAVAFKVLIVTQANGAVVIITTQLHSRKPEVRFCAGSNPARGVSEIRDGEDLWQWSRLEIRLNAFRRSAIPQ